MAGTQTQDLRTRPPGAGGAARAGLYGELAPLVLPVAPTVLATAARKPRSRSS